MSLETLSGDVRTLRRCSSSARSFASVSRILRTRLRIPQAASGPRPTFAAPPHALNSSDRTRLRARSFRGLVFGGMMRSLCVRGDGAFESCNGTKAILRNANVSQLIMSQDFGRCRHFKRENYKAHERASLRCSRRDRRRSSPTCTDVKAENMTVFK